MRELSLIDRFHAGRQPAVEGAGCPEGRGTVAGCPAVAVLRLSRRPSHVPWIYEVYHAEESGRPEARDPPKTPGQA
jgi:hypothetical protein